MITLVMVVRTTKSGVVRLVKRPNPVIESGIPFRNREANIRINAIKIMGEKR